MSQGVTIDVRFHVPPDDLRRYFTTFYSADFHVPDDGVVLDQLQPEWANLRFFDGTLPDTWLEGSKHLVGTNFTATGPSSHAISFTMGSTRMWGIGLLPLGWARFIGAPAADHANAYVNGHSYPVFQPFSELARTLFTGKGEEDEFARIVDYFRAIKPRRVIDEHKIQAIHGALIDPELCSVSELVERVGVSQRTLERLCHRHFGFSPKLLLRRQRFMRSLSAFMLDPSLKWIGAIDSSYHDQAQFVRDFHEFMGMTPREYAAMPHPILDRFMHERARVRGAAVQTLDSPDGARPRG